VVHVRPGLSSADRTGFGDVDRLLADSYAMAFSVLDQCWEGTSLEPGHYHLAVPAAPGRPRG